MPFDGSTFETSALAAEVEGVLRGTAPLPHINSLYGLIEEVELSARFYPGGPIRAEAVVRELYQLASEIRRRG